MPMLVRREEAVGALGDERLALLLACVESAWAKYEERFRPVLPLCSPIGMANILRELAVEEARQRLSEESGFTVHEPQDINRILVIADGLFSIQFRKLTTDFQTRNNPTQTSEAFDRQEPGIDGIPNLPRLTVGWQLGQYRTSLSEVYLAFLVGKKCEWFHDLRSGEHSLEFNFPRTEGPSAAEQEAEQERLRRVAENESLHEEGGLE